jgi:hypothetical protein
MAVLAPLAPIFGAALLREQRGHGADQRHSGEQSCQLTASGPLADRAAQSVKGSIVQERSPQGDHYHDHYHCASAVQLPDGTEHSTASRRLRATTSQRR